MTFLASMIQTATTIAATTGSLDGSALDPSSPSFNPTQLQTTITNLYNNPSTATQTAKRIGFPFRRRPRHLNKLKKLQGRSPDSRVADCYPPGARLPVKWPSQWPGVHPLAYRCGGSPGFAPPQRAERT